MQWKEFRSHLSHLSSADQARVEKAFVMAQKAHDGQMRKSGEPYFTHPLAVAAILAALHADAETLIAALLHDAVEDTPVTLDEIDLAFNGNVRMLIDGVTKLSRADIGEKPTLDEQIETLRKMFTLMEQDIRIMVIKLADRLHNMQTAEFLATERQKTLAQETMDVYVKIADRLSMQDIRDELEMLCLAILDPKHFSELEQLRMENEVEGKKIAHKIHRSIRESKILHNDIHVLFESRTWKRLEQQHATGITSYVLALVVPNIDDCYQALGILHQMWQREILSFQDFINSPMVNGYRGLHTTIILEDGTRVRCKIRTTGMQEYAHRGIIILCFRNTPKQLETHLPWTKRISTLSEDTTEKSSEFWDSLQSDILGDSIVIHGPSDETIPIPKECTALDGAFYLFDNRALQTTSILVNGAVVPFHTPLVYADSLDVEFSKSKTVSHEWLSWVNTGTAKAKIRSALGAELPLKKSEQGEALLQKQFDRYGMGNVQKRLRQAKHLLEKYNVSSAEELFTQIAQGTVDPSDILHNLRQENERISTKIFRSFWSHGKPKGAATLRIYIHGKYVEKEESISKTLDTLSTRSNVILKKVSIKHDKKSYSATIVVSATNESSIDRFFAQLEAQSGVEKISAVPPLHLMVQLAGIFVLTITTWGISFFSLQNIQGMHTIFSYAIAFPIVLCNIVAYRYISDYVAVARRSQLFIASILIVNAVTIALFTVNMLRSNRDTLHLSLFFPLTILVFSGIALIWTFAKQNSHDASPISQNKYTPQQWRKHQREKMFGYVIRLCAVVLWGIEPLYIRYSVINELEPIVRVFLKAMGGILPSLFLGMILFWGIRRKPMHFRLPYTPTFAMIIIGELLFAFFMNASLIFTTSTNLILINSFAPVIGLIIATIFWRDQIPYLRQPKYLMSAFALFVIGSMGSSFIFYHDSKFGTPEHLLGDLLSLLTMLADVFLVIAMIRYVKNLPKAKSIELNFNIFLFTLFVTAPIVLLSSRNIWHLTKEQWLFGLGAGVLSGFGRIMNFAAFRRIDGFLAFLMFNISIFITFFIEAFYIKGVASTPLLLTGGLLIIGASLGAEFINTKSEREAVPSVPATVQ